MDGTKLMQESENKRLHVMETKPEGFYSTAYADAYCSRARRITNYETLYIKI